MKTVIGVMDSAIGGVNSYIANYIRSRTDEKFTVLVNGEMHASYADMISKNAEVQVIPSVARPVKLYRRVSSVLKDFSADSVYLNVSTNLFLPVLFAAKKNKVKVIVHSHSSYSAEKKFIKRILIVLLHSLFRPVVNKISSEKRCCSAKAALWLFDTTKNVRFVHNAVSAQKFAFNPVERERIRKELSLEHNIVVGFVGMFCFQKNNEWFLRFAKCIKDERIKILMLGSGDNFDSFVKKMKNAKLESHFILLGNKTDAFRYYNAMDCFVLPSRFEGLPFVGIEAQANGLRCFFSSTISHETKITEEAEFFSLRNVRGIYNKICSLGVSDSHTVTPCGSFSDFVSAEEENKCL